MVSKLTSRKGSSNNRRNLCVCCFKERFVMRSFVLAGILVIYLFTNEIQSNQTVDESIIVAEVKRDLRNDPLPSKRNQKVRRKYTIENGTLVKYLYNARTNHISYINEEPRITDASKYKNKILLENYSYIHGPLRRVGPNCDRGYVHNPKFLIKNPVNFQIPDNERKYLCEPPGKGTELAEGASNLQKIREYIAMSKESRNVTLFCSVYTHSEAVNHTNAIKETWGKKCDGLLFASDISDLKTGHMHLPSKSKFGFKYRGMVQRTRTILAYLYDNFLDDYDYFHISGDDAFLIVENLKEFLASEKVKDWDKVSDQYMIAGFWMHYGAMKEGYFYLGGGSGYTLSKKALKAFVEGPLQTCDVKYDSSEEDVWFTKCARILTKNNFIDTRDASGAHRYHQMPVQQHATYPKIKFDSYEEGYMASLVDESLHHMRSNFMYPLVYMDDYISKSSIAFHKNYKELRRYQLLLYEDGEELCGEQFSR